MFMLQRSWCLLGAYCKSVDKECYPWLIDSGASSHMTKEKHDLMNFQEFEGLENVALGEGRVAKALGSGCVQMNVLFPANEPRKLSCIMCCTSMCLNLLVTCFL